MRLISRGLSIPAILLLFPVWVFAHAERPTDSPPRNGPVPDQNRTPSEVLDICKVQANIDDGSCYEHIQQAVNAASNGALIRIWPGFYEEEPSRQQSSLPPDNPDGTYSYQHHLDHPHSQNLIAILGKDADGNCQKCNLTLRGMGKSPRDVVIDAEFKKHVGIRGDRADGLIIENVSVWHAFDHGVYVLDTDGFVLDRLHSGYSREYPFLTFANDYGLMSRCEAFGGGDGGIYPGGSADTPGRNSMEVAYCKSYHNVLGYSGTQGDHVWVHDTEFYDNAIGLVSDSETDHPNYPENNLTLERNLFYDNNFNVYDPSSDVKATVFADDILIPVGVGVFLASGNDNLVQKNDIWGNDHFGVWLASGEGLVVGPTSDPPAAPFASSGNSFIANNMHAPASPPSGASTDLNGTDFGWDGMGYNNCWEGNVRDPQTLEPATTDALFLPPCSLPAIDEPVQVGGGPVPFSAGVPTASNALAQAGLTFVPPGEPGRVPLCTYYPPGIDPCIWGPGPAPENSRNLPDGYQAPPSPVVCGPGPTDPCP